jgi:hypothetical protein
MQGSGYGLAKCNDPSGEAARSREHVPCYGKARSSGSWVQSGSGSFADQGAGWVMRIWTLGARDGGRRVCLSHTSGNQVPVMYYVLSNMEVHSHVCLIRGRGVAAGKPAQSSVDLPAHDSRYANDQAAIRSRFD